MDYLVKFSGKNICIFIAAEAPYMLLRTAETSKSSAKASFVGYGSCLLLPTSMTEFLIILENDFL